MRKWNKLLALVLAMVMVFGLTATAFATEGDKTEEPKTTAAPAEGEEKTDDAAPAEGEEETDDAAPAEGEEKTDDAEPAEGEEKTDDAEPAAVTFSDVAEGAWYYEYVIAMAKAGIVKGNPDGTFKPDDSINWGAALKMVIVFVTNEEKAPVEGGDWASGYVAYAKEAGLVDGDVDITATITRAEVCQVLAKALKLEASEEKSTFPDTEDGYVMALVALKVISGNPDGTFDPDGALTRAAVCRILASVPEDAKTPAEGDKAPAEGEDADKAPAEGEDADKAPAEGEDADKAPAEGEDADKAPAEGEDADKAPAEGEDADKAPAEGEDAGKAE